MIETKAGLPNTCSECGTPQAGTWYAASVDMARSGQGLCATCAGKGDEMELPEDVAQEAEGGVVTVVPEEAGATDATPAAEELAAQEGIDLSTVKGTGKEGRITKGDVDAAVTERAEG